MISEDEVRDETAGSEPEAAETVENAAEPESTDSPETAVSEPEAAETVENAAEPETPETAEKSESPEKPESWGGFRMPEGAVSSEDVVGHDFWEGLTLPEIQPKKRSVKGRVFTLVMCLVFMAAGFGIACVTARGRGVLSNLVTGNKRMTFSLPVAEKPTDERFLTDDSGRYTAEGISEVCGPSVVSLDIYGESSALLPIGQGSGIIISADGYIVSNAHVVDKGTRAIKAVLSDGREYAAEVIGSDSATDIAVIKIPATDITPAVFGDSDEVHLGEEVVAIGCPAGYRNSVTKGVVSGLRRRIRAQNSMVAVNCIQIDAAVNPGNSGGALFNMWGQVVGVTSSKLASVDYEGIGFAISSNDAKMVIETLIETGRAKGRVRIGITYTVITPATAEMNGVEPGIIVVAIDKSCDIANTDLAIGDIITEIEGQSVAGDADIISIVQAYEAGDTITAHVYRPASEDSEATEFDISFKVVEDPGTLVEDDR